MWWPWQKKNSLPPAPEVETDIESAKEALEEEERKGEMVEKREEVIDVVTRQARILREQNHFAEAFRHSMRRSPS